MGVPGFEPELVSRRVLDADYIYVEDRDLLTRVESHLDPGDRTATARFRHHESAVRYAMCHRVSKVAGLERMAVMDRRQKSSLAIKVVNTPNPKPSTDDGPLSVEPGTTTVVRSAFLPNQYHIFWDVTLGNRNEQALDDDDERGCFVDGYSCTPIARACILFGKLLDEDTLSRDPSADWCDGGAVTRLLDRVVRKQNGHLAAQTCARQLETAEKLKFVFDFVASGNTAFEQLQFTLDAGNKPLQDLPAEEFEHVYGLPRRLEFAPARGRTPMEIDWLSRVYC